MMMRMMIGGGGGDDMISGSSSSSSRVVGFSSAAAAAVLGGGGEEEGMVVEEGFGFEVAVGSEAEEDRVGGVVVVEGVVHGGGSSVGVGVGVSGVHIIQDELWGLEEVSARVVTAVSDLVHGLVSLRFLHLLCRLAPLIELVGAPIIAPASSVHFFSILLYYADM